MAPKTILVPLDGSDLGETAIEPALALASGFGADVLVLRATWHRPPEAETVYLHDLAERLGRADVRCETVHGFPATEISRLVATLDRATLCLSTRGHSGAGELILGSVAAELIERSHIPAVLVGPACAGTPIGARVGGNVIFCFDASFAARALESTVIEWASRLRLQVQVVTVLHRDNEFLGNVAATTVCGAAAEFVDRVRAQGLTGQHLILDGLDPARTIAHAAAVADTALIVAGTTSALRSRGLARVSRAVLGSTAERLVRHATVPVLVAGG